MCPSVGRPVSKRREKLQSHTPIGAVVYTFLSALRDVYLHTYYVCLYITAEI